MEGWRKNVRSTYFSSTSSRLWSVMVSVVLVFGIMVLLWGYNWDFASNYQRHPWGWNWKWPSSSTAFSSNVVEDPTSSLSGSPSRDGGAVVRRVDDVDQLTPSPTPSRSTEDVVVVVGGGIITEDNFNHSSSPSPPPPPPPPPPLVGIQVGIQKEGILDNTNNRTTVSSSNGSHAPPLSARINRNFSNLERLEARMQQARLEIRDATKGNQSRDPDYLPMGPMYWNANAFHRSYLEMEKQFKVYVYEEGEPPIFHNGPCKSIYSMEGNFIYQMEMTKFRTRDPNKAHVYFLPISVTAIVHFIYEKKLKDHWKPMKQTVSDYVTLVSTKYPYWNRSLGADHLMLSCHDWGPELSSSVPELYKNSIRALCNANTSEGFNPIKDVSFPEIHLPGGTLQGLIGGPSPSQRPILAFFAGGVHGPIRPVLLEHWENKDEDIQVHRYLPKGVSYLGMMKKSKFCICPSGYEVASPRMVEALYSGCVPVLIKDHYVPPFNDVLNWKSFAVEIPVKDIPNLKKILTSISTRQYIRIQRRGKQIRQHFEVNSPPKRYDVFHMILHSVWLRRLNLRIHGTRDF